MTLDFNSQSTINQNTQDLPKLKSDQFDKGEEEQKLKVDFSTYRQDIFTGSIVKFRLQVSEPIEKKLIIVYPEEFTFNLNKVRGEEHIEGETIISKKWGDRECFHLYILPGQIISSSYSGTLEWALSDVPQ